jgi:hypothetical protein
MPHLNKSPFLSKTLSWILIIILAITLLLAGWLTLPKQASGAVQASVQSRSKWIPTRQIDPASWPLLTQNDLEYIGAYSVPHQDSAGNPLGYSGHALSYNPIHHSLYFGGHDWYQQLCEIDIPASIDLSQTASILQDCTDVSEGRLAQVDDGSIKLGGTLLFNDQLIVSAYSYYDADGNQSLSHFVSDPNLSTTGEINGPYQVGSWAGIVSGYMAPIPPEWQPSLGGPALTGNCCLSIISRTSYGPAVSVFNPAQLGVQIPAPADPLLYYPSSHPLANWDATSDLFNGSTNIVGVVFPRGTRSILFIGRQGIGDFCYGTGEECNDPVDSSKGTHAYPYIHQIWAYDALDLLAVKNGQMQAWEIQPYALWHLTEMDNTGSATISGATYDPWGASLYVTENYGEHPAVHVYQIDTITAPTLDFGIYLPLIGAGSPQP